MTESSNEAAENRNFSGNIRLLIYWSMEVCAVISDQPYNENNDTLQLFMLQC